MSAPAPNLSDETREAAAEWCVRLSDGPLGEHDRQAFQAWLDASPDHPALFERTVVAWTAIEDPLRPFSVQAGPRMVIATGTQFSVEKLSGEVRVVL